MTMNRPSIRQWSMRNHLLLGILLPVVLFIIVDAMVLYRQALSAVTTAYDRTLLASAKSIGEHISAQGNADQAQLSAIVPYAALEVFEADNRSRMVYRISSTSGELIDGFADLPLWRGKLPQSGPYAALADFYDDVYQGQSVRVAVLLQPVAMNNARVMAMVQVAETLELRSTLAREIFIDTLLRQFALITIIGIVVYVVVQRVTAPVRRLSSELGTRRVDDLTPLPSQDTPKEIWPLVEATNTTMQRLQQLLGNQKRFVRDTAHQLRTPLAVLKVQVQSALRGDIEPKLALTEISYTVQRATTLANQMLALAKVAQLSHENSHHLHDWALCLRDVALDLSPLIADQALDFDIDTQPCPVRSHTWMLCELSRNLLHNAIKHSPQHGKLRISLINKDRQATLVISDQGPGLSDDLRARLFQPFSAESARSGSGLGLAICQEIVTSLGGQISLHNRTDNHLITGMDAVVTLPLA